MGTGPDVTELQATAARMEAKYLDHPLAAAAYASLQERFDIDLSDARDVLLSRCAALMMLKAIAEAGGRVSSR